MSDFRNTKVSDGFDDPDDILAQPHGRRASGPLMEMLVHKVVGMESRIGDRIGLMFSEMKQELKNELKAELREEFKLVVPNGDIEGHRKAHEDMIKSASRWENFRYAIFEHIAKYVGLAVLIYVCLTLFDNFKAGLK